MAFFFFLENGLLLQMIAHHLSKVNGPPVVHMEAFFFWGLLSVFSCDRVFESFFSPRTIFPLLLNVAVLKIASTFFFHEKVRKSFPNWPHPL